VVGFGVVLADVLFVSETLVLDATPLDAVVLGAVKLFAVLEIATAFFGCDFPVESLPAKARRAAAKAAGMIKVVDCNSIV